MPDRGGGGAGSFQMDILRQVIKDEIEYHYDTHLRNDILSLHHEMINRMYEQQVWSGISDRLLQSFGMKKIIHMNIVLCRNTHTPCFSSIPSTKNYYWK